MTGCTITDISWERVHLTLTAVLSEYSGADDRVQFLIVDADRGFPVETTPLGGGRYRLEINVTNFSDRGQVPNGTWRFVPTVDGEPVIRDERQPADTWAPAGTRGTEPEPAPDFFGGGPRWYAAGYDLNGLDRLDEDSRTYLYAKNQVAYVISFGLSEDDEHPEFLMRTYQLFRKPGRNRNAPRQPLRRRFTRWVMPARRRVKLANQIYRLARLVNRPPGNRILLASEMRATMQGNLARVHERMNERGLRSRFRIRYSFRTPDTATKWTTLRAVYLLATSDIVLLDDYVALLGRLQLAPETKIIQLWHAGSGFKAIGYSRFGRYGSPKLSNAHRMYTYTITGSKHLVPVYAEAFGIEESAVVATGLPRIDTFLDQERVRGVVKDFFTMYPHLEGKKIILFAPTFRGRGYDDAHYDYSRIDFAKLHEVCGDTHVVLFRMHHFIPEPVPIPPEYSDRLLDFASFPDTNDLLHVADVLITDYSSVIYEYCLLDKPMLFYAYDKEVYSAVRGFHRDYDETAPGKVCTTFEELVKAIQDEDYDTSKIETFRKENIDYVDTGSADRVIDWLILDDPKTSAQSREGRTPQHPAAEEPMFADETLVDQSEA